MKGGEWRLECGVFLVGAAMAATMIWAAWRLNDEPFVTCCAVFVAAFWGSVSALAVWARISAWSERREARDDVMSKVRYRI